MTGWTSGVGIRGSGVKGTGNRGKGVAGLGKRGRVGRFWRRGLYQNLLYFTDFTLFSCTSVQ